MRKCSKMGTRVAAAVLAVVLALSPQAGGSGMLGSVVYAASDVEIVSTTEAAVSEETENEETEATEAAEKVEETEAAGETEATEEVEVAEETEVTEETEASEKTEAAEEIKKVEETGGTATRSYDVTAPVIRSVEVLEAGQVLEPEDTVHFKVNAYDAESEIKSIAIWVTGRGTGEYIHLEPSVEPDVYTGEIVCENLYEDCQIDSVEVTDTANNMKRIYFSEDDLLANTKFTVNQKYGNTGTCIGEVPYTEVKIDAKDQLCVGDKAAICVAGDWDFEMADVYSVSVQWRSDFNWPTSTLVFDETSGTFRGEFVVDEYLHSGIYEIAEIYIHFENGNYMYSRIDKDDSFSVNVVQTDKDETQPVIEEISIGDKQGEFVRPGDQVEVMIKASDDQMLSKWASVVFAAAAKDVSDASWGIPVEYNEETGCYYGTLEITDETYPCEWYLSYVNIRDEAGNDAQMDQDWYQNYPVYFNVENDGTFVENAMDMTVEIGYMDAEGIWQYDTRTVEHASRRSTLRELIGEFPETETPEGVTLLGWQMYDGKMVDLDTNVLCEYSYMHIQAVYDKYAVFVDRRWLTPDNLICSDSNSDTRFYEPGTLYTDILKTFEAPENTREGFLKWRLPDRLSDTVVEKGNNYLNVQAVYDSYTLLMSGAYMNAAGETIYQDDICVTHPQGTSMREVLDSIPKPDDAMSGWMGWKLANTYSTNEEDLVDDICYNYRLLPIEAAYEEYPVHITTRWLNKSCEMVSEEKVVNYPAGTKLNDIEAPSEVPEEIPDGMKFIGWKKSNYGDQTVSAANRFISMQAMYEGKYIAEIYYGRTWVNDSDWGSSMISATAYAVLDKETYTEEKALEALNNLRYEPYPGLRHGGWSNVSVSLQEETNTVSVWAIGEQFENCLIGFKYPEQETYEWTLAEIGDEITMPKIWEDYTDIKWGYMEDDSLTLSYGGVYAFTSSGWVHGGEVVDPNEPKPPVDTEEPAEPKPPVDTEKPAEPKPPVNPEKPEDSKPEVSVPQKPSEEEVAEKTKEIEAAKPGEAVKVDMSSATVVPKEILESAKGKDVEVVLDMGGYSWTINGKDIKDIKEINLEVKVDTNAVPTGTVKKLAGDAPVRQLSLTHNGDFGFKAELSINVGSENAGEFGNLFYYDSTGRLVFMNAGKIAEDGSVNLDFSHASDYVIVMGRDMTEDYKKTVNNDNNSNNNNNNNSNNDSNQSQTQITSPKTSDTQQASVVWAMLIMAAGGAALFAANKKRKKNY